MRQTVHREKKGGEMRCTESHKPDPNSSRWDTASKDPEALIETRHIADFK